MPSTPALRRPPRPPPLPWRRRTWLLALLALASGALSAADPELTHFEVTRGDDGLALGFTATFELPRGVEEALHKGVPLYFVARAELLRLRWYWRDRRVASVERVWRLAYQPLTRKYRVSFGGLNQGFDALDEALANVRRVSHWKIAEANQIEADAPHALEFSYRLDTSLLPRPMQIGIGGQPEWNLRLDRVQRIE